MAFSRRKGAGSDSTKRSRLGRAASRDPFAHLSDERAKAEEGEPWFLAGEDDESDLDVQAGISSNLKPEDLALLQEGVVEPPTSDEVGPQDPLQDPQPPAAEDDPYGVPEIAPGTGDEHTGLPDSEVSEIEPRSSVFDLPEKRGLAGETPFEGGTGGALPPPEPETTLALDPEPDVELPAEPERRSRASLEPWDTLTQPVVDQASAFDRPGTDEAYPQPTATNAIVSEPGAGVVAEQEVPTGVDLLEDADGEPDLAEVFPDEILTAEVPPEPLEPVDATVFHELDGEMAGEGSEETSTASFVIDVEAAREEASQGNDQPQGSEGLEVTAPPEEEPLRSALLQSFRDVVARAPASPEHEDEDYDPKHRRPGADAAEPMEEHREVRPRKPPARPRRF